MAMGLESGSKKTVATIVRTAGPANFSGARVIRAVGSEASVLELEVSRNEETRREAADLVRLAREEADAIRQQAHDEGLATGLAAALLQDRGDPSAQSAQSASTVFMKLVQQIEQARAEWLLRWERNIIGLAVAMAQRIVRREVREQPEIALDLVRESLELSTGCVRIRLGLQPDDLATLGAQVRQMIQQLGRVADIELVADELLERGECRVSTDHGEIDQRFSTQLARLVEELT